MGVIISPNNERQEIIIGEVGYFGDKFQAFNIFRNINAVKRVKAEALQNILVIYPLKRRKNRGRYSYLFLIRAPAAFRLFAFILQ